MESHACGMQRRGGRAASGAMDVTVAGTGYVGLITSLTLAYLGHRVHCLDVDEAKVDSLRSGRVPFHEPYAEDMLEACRDRLCFTSDERHAIGNADVIFIAVGTPSAEDGSADMRYVREAAGHIGRNLAQKRVVVINKSTVPIGSASLVELIVRQAYEEAHGAPPQCLSVASNPEFLREGSALADSLYPDRIVLGASEAWAFEQVRALYRPLMEQSFAAPEFLPRPACAQKVALVETSVVSAELVKYAANAFLATKISFANEVAALAECCGANIADVTRGMGMDRRIGPAFLNAGIGWGGSCFEKDTAALTRTAAAYDLSMPVTEAARAINRRQRLHMVSKLQKELRILQGKVIGVLGLAFKPHTDDLRDSPGIEIISRLLQAGARVRAHDPQAMRRAQSEHAWEVEYCRSAETLAHEADALLLTTEWPQYGRLPWKRMAAQMRQPVMVDGRNFLDRATMERAGFRYVDFGRCV